MLCTVQEDSKGSSLWPRTFPAPGGEARVCPKVPRTNPQTRQNHIPCDIWIQWRWGQKEASMGLLRWNLKVLRECRSCDHSSNLPDKGGPSSFLPYPFFHSLLFWSHLLNNLLAHKCLFGALFSERPFQDRIIYIITDLCNYDICKPKSLALRKKLWMEIASEIISVH